MRYILSSAAGAAAVAALAFAGQAEAAVLVSNYPSANDDSGTTLDGPDRNYAKAAGFTIAAGVSYALDTLTMRLAVSDVARTIGVSLFGGTAADPSGSALDTFIVPAFTVSGNRDYTFHLKTPFTLLAGSTYWIVAFGTNSGKNELDWLAASDSKAPTGLAVNDGYRVGDRTPLPPTDASNVFNTYSVQGTAIISGAVPEPATWAMLLLGMGAVGYTVRRRPKVVVRFSQAG